MMNSYYLLFLILAIFMPRERKVWGILFFTSCLIVINKNLLPNDYGSWLYVNRSVITFVACFLLIKVGTLHAYYQAGVYIATLILFLTLEIDVVFVQNIVYDKYEYYTYGIVLVKFLGFTLSVQIFNTICNADYHFIRSIGQRGQK